jgi:hypothetical protein
MPDALNIKDVMQLENWDAAACLDCDQENIWWLFLVKKVTTILIVLLLLCSCSSRFVAGYYHDAQNPCTIGQYYFDKNECECWMDKYPKDYARYLARIERYKAEGMHMYYEGKKLEIKAHTRKH